MCKLLLDEGADVLAVDDLYELAPSNPHIRL
jgi:predicted RNase H-like nuclease (RuvC/YqgF family)